tara:strand:+ start:2149 stop:3222 length:1074 start_codon:yes stop_codon:yes gene_type:complete
MRTYIKFIIYNFSKSLLYTTGIVLSLVFVLNLLTELEFFKDINVGINLTLILTFLNTPSMLFEVFPFIFLIATQLFFIKLFNNNEIEVFKYSGLKNSSILKILSVTSLVIAIFITAVFYNISSTFKNFYLEIKSKYTSDGKYLAVITNNGLWIKDIIDNKILIINSSKLEKNFLINNFITEFDNNYNVIRNLRSNKIDIKNKKWIIYDAKIYKKNIYDQINFLELNTNFNYEQIQNLFSNLSSLNMFQLIELRKNYKKLNYSLVEIDIHLLKLLSYPFYLLLMSIFASLIMFRLKRLNSATLRISIGLLVSVLIYYINNFFLVMGSTERLSVTFAIFIPLGLLMIMATQMLRKINEN